MNIALARSEWLSKALAILIAIICFAGQFYYNNARMIYLSCLAICAILMVLTIKHKYIFVIVCFISSYIILLYPYFINNLSIGTFQELNQASLYQKTLYLFSVFLSSILFFFKSLPEIPIIYRLPVYDRSFIFGINTVAMICVVIFGAKGQTILSAGYGLNQGSASIVYTYFPILYLASYLCSGRHRLKIFLINVIGLAFILKSLLFGGRGNTITMLLIMYLLFIDARISFPVLIVFILAGFTFFGLWGQFRGNLNLSALRISDVFSLGASYDKYTGQSNNQTDVFYASVRIVTMVDVGIINAYQRLEALILFCLSVVVPYSILPPLSNLASYNLGTYNSLGGGLIFAYFYAFLSYFGLVFAGYIINLVWTKLRTSTSKYTLVYCILVVGTINGWFAYNPITMFKLCSWGVLYVFTLDVINAHLSKRL